METHNETITALSGVFTGMSVVTPTSATTPYASKTPMIPPVAASTADSIMNCSKICILRAPSERRIPISLVRSVTLANMMFMMTMPPTTRNTLTRLTATFASVDPIGKTVRAETHEYQVIGVAERIGSAFGQSQDNFMIIPLHTFEKELHRPRDWVGIFVQAGSAEMMSACEDEARMLMRAWRHLPYDAVDNFAILGSDSIMKLWHDLTGTLAGVAVGLVSVFLVVGGIVIMNIMLASVTERTREIGIRRSLGARKKHILLQFMMESAVLASTGGIIGVLLAYALVALVGATTSIPVKTPLSAVITSLVVSTAVGLFFGIYPATRAARLDPIEALRAEN